MIKLYIIIGAIVFWVACAVAVWLIAGEVYQLWKKYRYRIWIYQAYETYGAWYKWRYKKVSFDKINGWRYLPELREWFDTDPHHKRNLFRKFWISLLDDMLSSEQYKKWSED
jgi:hypothetical protein